MFKHILNKFQEHWRGDVLINWYIDFNYSLGVYKIKRVLEGRVDWEDWIVNGIIKFR